MRKTLKKILSLLLVLTLVLGSGYSSYAVKNTSIHLKTGSFSELQSMSIYVYISGHHGTEKVGVEHVVLESGAATKLTLSTTGGSGQFSTTDLELAAEPIILYFSIGGYKYYVGTHIERIGNEGGGTMNYEVTCIPSYSVSYDANTGTGTLPAATTSYNVGSTVTVLGNINNITKANFTFNGWNTAANGLGTSYTAGNTFKMGNSDVVLYAQWLPDNPTPTKYTLTYNANGGDVTVPSQELNLESGDTPIVGSPSALSYPSFLFTGWNTESDGSGLSYAPGSIVTIVSSNVILFAQWTPYYTVNYDGNGNTGGTAPTDSNQYETGDLVTVKPVGDLVKDLHTFGGWNTQANGQGTTYASTFAIDSANVTLYAIWNENIPPTTAAPTTAEPTTAAPTTAEPTTAAPTTAEPTTAAPTTAEPTTAAPTTAEPTTAAPTTAEPTTAAPTTAEPTTAAPTTVEPTTAAPTTAEPTTAAPTTVEPTTAAPTTVEPTTAAPTSAPTTEEPATEPSTIPTTEGEVEELTEELIPEGAAIIINFDEPLDSSTFEEVIELGTEAIPLAPALPQTGQLPVELFYGIGGLITAAGVFLKKK